MQSQLQARQQGTWPEFGFDMNYLVVAGGGGGGRQNAPGNARGRGGGGAGGYRASGFGPSPLQGDALFIVGGAY